MSTSKHLLTFFLYFLCFVDHASLYNLVNKANLVHNFSQYAYFSSLNVSGDYVPIIRRNSCVYGTLGTCYSVWMTVWYAGWIPDSHPYRITSTKCRINTVVSPDDGHIVTQNVEKRNKLLCTKLALFTRLPDILKEYSVFKMSVTIYQST